MTATTGSPRRRVPRAEREEQMVTEATRIFAARGFHAASMDEIAEASGITKPMLYAYFDSKEGLFLACVERGSAELRAQVRAAALAAPTPERALYDGLVAVMRFVEDNEELWSVLYPHGPSSSGTFAAAAARAHDEMSALLTELMTMLATRRGVADEVALESEPLAHALTGATIALGTWSRGRGEPAELHALRLMNFAWKGLGDMLEGDLWLPGEGAAG
ncbi:MAG TPA: TetR/AcrR family transcriptional regulator [Thermoleophilaceae bacterium]|jgi:AcrR family transcriptional regulator